ncbi:MAG TPA: tetratricopeptide repeat protein [Chthoniobacterales bacterium]|nr:tetratricopeptide repeat protein [Chthoniobacterales bacterium]
MKIRRLAAISLLVLGSFASTGLAAEKSSLEAMYDRAFTAFDAARYDEALKALDAIDARQPDLAESFNLRGVVLMRQGKYDKAEVALRKALSIEPKFWNASFNLAEIPFLKKDWAAARTRFEGLMSGENSGMQPETSQLIQYKILLTFVLEGKENTVDWILNKFELSKDSPALYYSNAAIALEHKNQAEAKEWMDAAEKKYPGPLNKLYAESFYEIGWLQKPSGESRPALEITSTADRVARMQADAKANFEKAERAFQQRDFDGALKLLDLATAGAPNDAASDNLRGEILMEQKKFDEAEVVLRRAFATDPKFREAQYNLAQIPFKKGEYAKARDRLEALFGETPGDEKNQAAQLIKYKIFLTLLLEGKESEAQQLMEQFKFTGDTPALYYAQAAWEYKHGHEDQGSDWVTSARKIYSPALNIVFADTFYDLGWLKNPTVATAPPPTSALAQADASPLVEPTPAMRLGQMESRPVPDLTGDGMAKSTDVEAKEPAAPTPAATGLETTAPIATGPVATAAQTTAPTVTAAQTTAPIATAPTATGPETTPGAMAAAVAAATPLATAVPAVSPASKPATSPIAVASSAVNVAAPSLAATQTGASSRSTFGEMIDRVSSPLSPLVGVLLLAGIVLLLWLVMQQIRRYLANNSLFKSSTPLTEPPFAGDEPMVSDEHRISNDILSSGPPKVSLQLKASEPSVRAAVLPSGAITARGAVPGVPEPFNLQPNELEGSIAEVMPAPVSARPPVEPGPTIEEVLPAAEAKIPAEAEAVLRDQEEVSLPAALEVPAASLASQAAEPAAPDEPVAPVEPVPAQPVAEKSAAEEAAMIAPEIILEPAISEFAGHAWEKIAPELEPVASTPIEEPALPHEEPIGQGQPIPQLTTALAAEAVTAEVTPPTPETPLVLVEPEAAVPPPIAEWQAPQSSIETPSFASKIITTEPIRLQPTTPVIMPETTITPAPAFRAATPTMSVQQPLGGMHTAVQLTFSLEIASMQLTPTFKMSGLQLKPISKVVSMRLAPSQDPQPPMNLQVTFEVAKIELSGGSIGTVRLAPSLQEKPAALSSPSFAISGLELVAGAGTAPVQLTPSHQEQASVLLTAHFQIAAIEFSPLFEIAAIVLTSTSKHVSMQLPGSGPSSIDNAPVFQIENVQLGAGADLNTIQVTPIGTGRLT